MTPIPPLSKSLETLELLDLIIPSDAYAIELAEQFNIRYGLYWSPEYVQYWSTRADLTLEDTLVEFLDLIAQHEFLTKDV
jgi:hypothetical protein